MQHTAKRRYDKHRQVCMNSVLCTGIAVHQTGIMLQANA